MLYKPVVDINVILVLYLQPLVQASNLKLSVHGKSRFFVFLRVIGHRH